MPFANVDEDALFSIGPGTPSGEVFRRYWLPVEASANLGPGPGLGPDGGPTFAANNPLRLTVLGEDLVLFRDGSGKPGLVAEHCSHRGTSLFYGAVETEGIRCLYHGWAYGRDGTCVDTPGEPPSSNLKRTVKQPAYPCKEVGGLIFAYLGPTEKKPPFPRYEQLFRTDGVRVVGNGGRIQRSNVFLQTLDNVLDPWHQEFAHGWFKGTGRRNGMHYGRDGDPPTPVKFDRTPWGARYVTVRSTGKAGRYNYHETHAVLPCQRVNLQKNRSIKWAVPIDDYSTRWFGVDFYPLEDGEPTPEALRAINNFGPNDSRAILPDDWVEQVGAYWNYGHPLRQGQIWEDEVVMGTQGRRDRGGLPDWEKWRLGTTDRGVQLMHELWREQVERVAQGLDPEGIVRGEAAEQLIKIPADVRDVDWDTGLRWFDMTIEERLALILAEEARR